MRSDELIGSLAALLELPQCVQELNARIRELQQAVEQILTQLPPALAPVPEAARLMNVSESTVRRQIRAGTLPAIRVGNSVRVDVGALRTRTDDEVARLSRSARSASGGHKGNGMER